MEYNVALLIIIAVNVIVSIKGFDDHLFFHKYQFRIGNIRSGELYRMITSGFLHADIPHLAFNMIALFSFAGVVTQLLGTFSFVIIYVTSLVFGSLLTIYFHKNDLGYSAVGASGAVTGVIYSAILLVPNLPINIMFIPIDIPGYIFGVLYLLYSIYGLKAKNDNIGHTAHIGGAIGGYIFTLINVPNLFLDNPLIVIGLAIPIVILFIMAKKGKF